MGGRPGIACRLLLAAALLLSALLLAGRPALAAPAPAGTVITSFATGTYLDLSGKTVNVTSNTVQVTILPFEACSVSAGQTVTGIPGATVSLPHVITNTGNTTETCSFTTATAGSYTPQAIHVVKDASGSGVATPSDPAITSVTLAPGASANVIVVATVPPSVAQGSAAQVTLTATSTLQHAAASATDTVVVGSGAVLSVTKSASTATPAPGGQITYTLVATNTGNAAASGSTVVVNGSATSFVILRDAVPAGTTFLSATPAGGATLLYHRVGDPGTAYVTAQPPAASVDGVAWGVPTLAANAGITGVFTVTVGANATGTLTNTGYSDYASGGTAYTAPSNTVQLTLPALAAPSIAFFGTSGYATPISQAPLGAPLYLQLNAAACSANPAQVTTLQLQLVTQLSHDKETVTATETAAGSGVFRVNPPIPTADAATKPVAHGDGVLEMVPGDTVTATVLGCSAAASVSTKAFMQSQGVVYDSHTNAPVAGATVALISSSGQPAQVFGPDGVTPAPSSVVTGVDGTYTFDYVAAGTYSVVVRPPAGYAFPSTVPVAQQPAGRFLDAAASYGRAFSLPMGGGVDYDIPLDPVAATATLTLQKTASKQQVQAGDMLDYTIQVGNQSPVAVPNVVVTDWLPMGFAYQRGTTRIGGAPAADPKMSGGTLGFMLGTLAPGTTTTITYRVGVTASAPEGQATNSAQAQGGAVRSITAQAVVNVVGGVFGQQAMIFGKVYLDCHRDRVQDAGDPGVPGVRIWLADGTYAVTDGAGKYSLYALTPRTTVAAVDPMTLPEGAKLEILNHRNAGDPGSQFADLKNGEMHRVDFAVAGCDPAVRRQVEERRKALDDTSEIAALAGNLPLATQVIPSQVDQRTLPSNGTMGPNGALAAGTLAQPANPLDSGPFGSPSLGVMPLGAVGDMGGSVAQQSPAIRPLFPAMTPVAPRNPTPAAGAAPGGGTAPHNPAQGSMPPASTAAPSSNPGTAEPERPGAVALTSVGTLTELDAEKVLKGADNTLGFVGLSDGDVLPSAQTRVAVKGPAGASLLLSVNGADVPQAQVGLKATLQSRHVSLWDYVGVQLTPGENELKVEVRDDFGNVRGAKTIHVKAPGNLATLRIVVPEHPIADAQTPALIKVLALDAHGLPVTARLPLTLTASQGIWQTKNLDPSKPGLHVFMEGGEGAYAILSPAHPGKSEITVESNGVKASAEVAFQPNLRPMFGVGLVDAILDFSKLSAGAVQPASASDGFEQAIGAATRSFDGGNAIAGVHSQVFLKGKILGSTLLTLAYDSDKPSTTQLFRSIRPDSYYPVYGDSSVKGFDAQSTGKLYVRLDRGTSYVLLGDFTTQTDNPARQLTQYSRALNGLRAHGEKGPVVVDAFASHTSSTQVVTEIQGNGTSGPYALNINGVINSQQVDLITRDRNQPSMVLSDKPLTPFVDYSIDPLTGQLMMTAPVPPVDANLNPVFVRVTYEVDQGGPKHWVGGASAQVQIGEAVNIGASAVKDDDPLNGLTLTGVNATVKVGSSVAVGELAHSSSATYGSGNAERLEWRGSTPLVEGRVWAVHTDPGFYNPSAFQSAGQSQYGAKARVKLSDTNAIAVEGLRSVAPQPGASQTGVSAAFEHSMAGNVKLSVGVRHAEGQALGAVPGGATAIPGAATVDFTSAFVRVDAPIPHVKNAAGFIQYERALNEDAQVATVGATYTVDGVGKFYLVHQTSNSLSGVYGLNPNVNQYTTVAGFQSATVDNTQYFNEYRIGQGLDGQAAESAIGLRHLWQVTPGLGISASVARIHPFYGEMPDTSTAFATAVSYTGSPTLKASARAEYRTSDQSSGKLFTGVVANKVNDNWTLLGRGIYSNIVNTGAAPGGSPAAPASQQLLSEVQGGFAYRPEKTNVWNAIGMLGYKRSIDTTQAAPVQTNERAVFAIGQVNVQPDAATVISARAGVKRALDGANGITSSGWTKLLGGRVTRDIGSRWDLGVQFFREWSFDTQQSAYGLELGYLLKRNLWVSVGYNLRGINDPDLAGGAYTQRGIYLRLRFKFSGNPFEELGGLGTPASVGTGTASSYLNGESGHAN